MNGPPGVALDARPGGEVHASPGELRALLV